MTSRVETYNGIAGLLTAQDGRNFCRLGTLRGFGAWQIAEFGDLPCDGVHGALWNFAASEQPWPGATDYNSVGVKNFPSFLDGIGATVQNLTDGMYADLLDVMSTAGVSSKSVCQAIGASPWGGSNHAAYTANLLGALDRFNSDRTHYYGLRIGPA